MIFGSPGCRLLAGSARVARGERQPSKLWKKLFSSASQVAMSPNPVNRFPHQLTCVNAEPKPFQIVDTWFYRGPKVGLAAKRAAGVVLGRPRTLPDEVVERIVKENASGAALSAIARGLNENATPTAQGGSRWYPSTVPAVLCR